MTLSLSSLRVPSSVPSLGCPLVWRGRRLVGVDLYLLWWGVRLAWGDVARRRRVVICSPFRSESSQAFSVFVNLAKSLVTFTARQGDAPFASHLFYPEFLDDSVEADRVSGLEAGCSWIHGSDLLVVLADLGVSSGMAQEIEVARSAGIPVEVIEGFVTRQEMMAVQVAEAGMGGAASGLRRRLDYPRTLARPFYGWEGRDFRSFGPFSARKVRIAEELT